VYGYVLASIEKFDKAEKIFKVCLSVIEENSGVGSWLESNVYLQYGRFNIWVDKPNVALTYLYKAKNIRTTLFGKNHRYTTDVSIYIGDALVLLKQYKLAFTYFDIGIKGRKLGVDEKSPNVAITKPLFSKAKAYYSLENYEKAEKIYKQIISIRLSANDIKSFNTAYYYKMHGLVSLKLNKIDQAIESLELALNIFLDDRYKNDKLSISETQLYLAKAFASNNENEKSVRLLNSLIPTLKESHDSNDLIFNELEMILNMVKSKRNITGLYPKTLMQFY
jgi:tetratricopeptide (TPR) repeat protein